MVSLAKIERGLSLWAHKEIVAKLPVGQGLVDELKKIGVSTGIAYIIKWCIAALEGIKNNPFLLTLGAVDANGDIDLDGVKDALMEQVPDEGLKITVPALNEITLYKADIESMYSYIMGG